MIKLKRAYKQSAPDDGYRVLVDRLWPRGVRKEDAAVDLWLKEVAPSKELRTWFGHDPAKYEAFSTRYQDELAHNPAVARLRDIINDQPVVTLVYGARDTLHNHALILQHYLDALLP